MPLQSLPRAAETYSRRQRMEIAAAVRAIRRQWRRMGDDFDTSYAVLLPSMLAVTDTAQERIVEDAVAYVPAAIGETGQDRYVDPAGIVVTATLVGVDGAGRPTDWMMRHAVVHAKNAVAAGMTSAAALASAGEWLTTATGTMLSDTGRAAETVQMGNHRVGGYVRMLNPPSCSRCAILAGKWFADNSGFQRHPGCFPAGAVVSGPAPEAATRRWYEGELAVVTVASGKKLTATGNHPILTDQGWVPAGLIQVGDNVLSSTVGQGAAPLVIPDEKQCPALIENVWSAGGMVPLGEMPTAPEDFHGDGGHGQVDVVLSDRLLRYGPQSAFDKAVVEELLAGRVEYAAPLASNGAGKQLRLSLGHASHSFVSSSGLPGALFGSHGGSAHLPGRRAVADLDVMVEETFAESVAADAEAATQAVLALSGLVGGHDLSRGQYEVGSRWDAPAGPLTMESRVAYAGRGADLARRLSSQVAADRVVQVERVEWSGHVYNLTSAEGWYCADGFIVSNCDCRHVPASESVAGDMTIDVDEYFNTLPTAADLDEQYPELTRNMRREAGIYSQEDVFGVDGAEAIRNGADIGQVVNARRGMSRAQSGRLARNTDFFGQYTTTAGRTRARSGVRLMPESIRDIATDKADYIRLLKLHGYIR